MAEPDTSNVGDEEDLDTKSSPGPNEASVDHLGLIVSFLRVFMAVVTVAYVGLIGVLCLHWLEIGDTSVLGLALLPGAMLLFLNAIVWMTRKPR